MKPACNVEKRAENTQYHPLIKESLWNQRNERDSGSKLSIFWLNYFTSTTDLRLAFITPALNSVPISPRLFSFWSKTSSSIPLIPPGSPSFPNYKYFDQTFLNQLLLLTITKQPIIKVFKITPFVTFLPFNPSISTLLPVAFCLFLLSHFISHKLNLLMISLSWQCLGVSFLILKN